MNKSLHRWSQAPFPRWPLYGIAWSATVLLSACVNTSFPTGPGSAEQAAAAMAAGRTAPSARMPARTYYLQPGDAFDVKLFYSPELNESVVIRPDGKISLQLVGELQAAGNSPREMEELIRGQYARVLREPAVTVVVRQVSSQRVFVAGEVRAPGEVPLSGDMTALQAIARAGFFTRDAESRQVVVLRYKGDAGPEFIMLDAKALVDGSAGGQADILLQAMDVVFVPQTQIAGIADFFGRYVNNIVPLWRNLGFSMIYYTNNARLVGP